MTDLAAMSPGLGQAGIGTEPLQPSGVVACAVYEGGRRVQDIAVEQCGAFIRREGALIWLGLHEPDAALLDTVRRQFDLHELIIEEANQPHARPKLEVYGEILFIVLRTAQLIDDKIRYGETHLVVGKGFVVSIRHGASAPYSEVRQRCERNPGLLRLGESAIVYAILDFVGDNYLPILDKITDELKTIEDDIFSTMPAAEKIERIYRLRAGLLEMRKSVAPMLKICNQLRRHDFPVKAFEITPYLHDVHDHVSMVGESIADLRERLTAVRSQSAVSVWAAERDRQEARGVGGDPRRADDDRRYLRYEFQIHARARLGLRLSGVNDPDGGNLRLSLLPIPPGRLALIFGALAKLDA
jgi:magnesium transporter